MSSVNVTVTLDVSANGSGIIVNNVRSGDGKAMTFSRGGAT